MWGGISEKVGTSGEMGGCNWQVMHSGLGTSGGSQGPGGGREDAGGEGFEGQEGRKATQQGANEEGLLVLRVVDLGGGGVRKVRREVQASVRAKGNTTGGAGRMGPCTQG